jgi:hypothetical protein
MGLQVHRTVLEEARTPNNLDFIMNEISRHSAKNLFIFTDVFTASWLLTVLTVLIVRLGF